MFDSAFMKVSTSTTLRDPIPAISHLEKFGLKTKHCE